MKSILPLSLLLGATISACAQTTDSFPIWPNGAPGALGTNEADIPTLTVYLPDKTNATGAAFVICPGGAYAHLADHEGSQYALWLNRMGIAGFVLKYRLGSGGYHHPAMLQDATRALRIVRSRAAEWDVDPHRIGIIGSSAGGHLASTMVTHFEEGDTNAADPIERVSSRPDLAVLCYPVITMGKFAHRGSKMALLGRNPSPELVKELSSELQVTKDSPPCFIWSTYEDKTVPVENSLMFADALRNKGVPFELHIYERGGHGQGLGTRNAYDTAKYLPWTGECERWLREHRFAN